MSHLCCGVGFLGLSVGGVSEPRPGHSQLLCRVAWELVSVRGDWNVLVSLRV